MSTTAATRSRHADSRDPSAFTVAALSILATAIAGYDLLLFAIGLH